MELLMDKARVYVLICKIDDKTAMERFIGRGLNNERREYFHGDKGVDMARKGMTLTVGPYDEPRLDAPTLHIDTLGDYAPSLDELEKIIFNDPTPRLNSFKR
jgi:hypothetical protein